MNPNQKRLRISFKDEVKIFPYSDTFEELEDVIGFLFNIPTNLMKKNFINFTYIDDDFDKVTISNNYDLQQAYIYAENANLDDLDMEMILTPKCQEGDPEYEMEQNMENIPYYEILTNTERSESREINKDYSYSPLNNEVIFLQSNYEEEKKENQQNNSKLEKNANIKNIFERYVNDLCIIKSKILNGLNNLYNLSKDKLSSQRKLKYLMSDYLRKKPMPTPSFVSDLKLNSPQIIFQLKNRNQIIRNNSNLAFDKLSLQEFLTNYINKKVKKFQSKLLKKTMKKAEKFIKKKQEES
jgi:hypothetical protein